MHAGCGGGGQCAKEGGLPGGGVDVASRPRRRSLRGPAPALKPPPPAPTHHTTPTTPAHAPARRATAPWWRERSRWSAPASAETGSPCALQPGGGRRAQARTHVRARPVALWLSALRRLGGSRHNSPLNSVAQGTGSLDPVATRARNAAADDETSRLTLLPRCTHARVGVPQARILQHEYDHLQGTLYTDRMVPRVRRATVATVAARHALWFVIVILASLLCYDCEGGASLPGRISLVTGQAFFSPLLCLPRCFTLTEVPPADSPSTQHTTQHTNAQRHNETQRRARPSAGWTS